MVRMSIFASRLGLALGLAVLSLGGRTAHAQVAAVPYAGWPLGFGSTLTVAQSANIYGNFSGLDGSGAGAGGLSYLRTQFPNGWFVGGETGGTASGINGISQAGAFGSLYYEGVQFGYNFQTVRGLPLTVYAGFDTPKYNTGIGNPFAPFDTVSGTLPGYRAHAGIEFQPAPNLSLSLDVGVTQQPSDPNALALPGASPFGFGGRR
jgi:hypothetical protein